MSVPYRFEAVQGAAPAEAYSQRIALIRERIRVARERGSSAPFIAYFEESLAWLEQGERIALAREDERDGAAA